MFQRAIDVVPNNALGHKNLGVALDDLGCVDDALAHFREVARLEPQNARAGEWVRRIEAQLGRTP